MSAKPCACGHDQHDHDWWGWGPCLACGCQRFGEAARAASGMNELQRAEYRSIRADWSQRWFYTARRAFELARAPGMFSVSRETFYRTVRIFE